MPTINESRNFVPLLDPMALRYAISALAQLTEEVPFITSPDNVTLEMLSIPGVKKSDHVIDLGSGNGRIATLTAKPCNSTQLFPT